MIERTIPFCQLAKAGYNRGIRRAHVNEIKNDFHEDMVEPAKVSFRDGVYYIVDHQHLAQAIYELNGCDPNTPIRCLVRTGLTYEQEADWYYRLNTGSKPLNAMDIIIGRIEAKDPVAVDYRNTVESCGYVVGGNTNKSLKAVGSTFKLFQKSGGKEALSQVLSLTYACWPDAPSGVDSRLIDGIVLLLRYHSSEFGREHFIKVMSVMDPRDIVKKSRIFYKQMDSKAFTGPYCTYTVLVTAYNTGLRSNKLVAVTPDQLVA